MGKKNLDFDMFVKVGKIKMCGYAFEGCEGALNKTMCFSYCVNNGSLDSERKLTCIKQELKDQQKVIEHSIKKHKERFY